MNPGFSQVDPTRGLGSSATIPVIPGLNPLLRTFNNLTADQAAIINTLVQSGVPNNICAARAYAFFASSGGSTALTGSNPLLSPNDGSMCPAISPITPGGIGPRFLLSGAPVPAGTTGTNGLPIAFRPLNDLQRVFPVTENTNFFSLRGDHVFNDRNVLSMRFGYNNNDLTGIQVESQNQSLGQNDFSRTGAQDLTDTSFNSTLTTIFSDSIANEFKFSFGRRETSFRSQNEESGCL